ncbi:MAG: hypothetical protein GY854_18345, partial [Deltaproteobacteria bacterium]|nr:hypothetical protein [Deltaproteobacteria bacterium]
FDSTTPGNRRTFGTPFPQRPGGGEDAKFFVIRDLRANPDLGRPAIGVRNISGVTEYLDRTKILEIIERKLDRYDYTPPAFTPDLDLDLDLDNITGVYSLDDIAGKIDSVASKIDDLEGKLEEKDK